MTDEMLSFLAGDSTPGSVKPAAYDTIDIPLRWTARSERLRMMSGHNTSHI